MSMEIGKILRSFIGKNLDSTVETQLFQAELAEDGDQQTIEELHIPGFQYRPAADSRPFIARVTDAWKICLGIDDFITKEVINEGERLIYADASGAITTKIHLKADGSIDIETLSAVNVIGDVIADGISLKTHFHQGNLGFPVGAPIQSGGGTTPSSLPTANATGEIIDGPGTNLSTHTHSQANDTGGDTEQDTSAPL